MKKLILILAVTAMLATMAFAHVHPLVPVECANSGNAGNTADPQNDGVGQDFIPGFIPRDNPGKAGDQLPLSPVDRPAPPPVGGPGVEPAIAHCANV